MREADLMFLSKAHCFSSAWSMSAIITGARYLRGFPSLQLTELELIGFPGLLKINTNSMGWILCVCFGVVVGGRTICPRKREKM